MEFIDHGAVVRSRLGEPRAYLGDNVDVSFLVAESSHRALLAAVLAGDGPRGFVLLSRKGRW